eukprot:2991207-Pyramimonas_sp.AAC.1
MKTLLPMKSWSLSRSLLVLRPPRDLEPVAIDANMDRDAPPTRHRGGELPPDSVGVSEERMSLANPRSTRDRET